MNKKRQHYIWKKYLYPWCHDKKIYANRRGNLFTPNIDNVGLENYFYYAEKLSSNEIEIIKYIIHSRHETAIPLLSQVLEIYQMASISEEKKINLIEEYHTLIEHSIHKSLEQLYNMDLSFFEDNDMKAKFCYFLGLQYSRTKNMKERITENIPIELLPSEKKKNVRPNVLAMLFSLMSAEVIGNWIFTYGNFCFLINKTDSNLITSDQPIINLWKVREVEDQILGTMKFYYPLTPRLALYIKDSPIQNHYLKEEDLIFYNKKITEKSFEFIFSKDGKFC